MTAIPEMEYYSMDNIEPPEQEHSDSSLTTNVHQAQTREKNAAVIFTKHRHYIGINQAGCPASHGLLNSSFPDPEHEPSLLDPSAGSPVR